MAEIDLKPDYCISVRQVSLAGATLDTINRGASLFSFLFVAFWVHLLRINMGQKHYGLAGLFEYSGIPLATITLSIFKVLYLTYAGIAYLLVGRADLFTNAKDFSVILGNEGDMRFFNGVFACFSSSIIIFWFFELYNTRAEGWPLLWIAIALMFPYSFFYRWRTKIEENKN